jgi:hypothetical protein
MQRRWQFVLAAALVVVGTGIIRGAWARDTSEASVIEVPEDYYALDQEPRRRARGALERVQALAEEMLEPGNAQVWGRDPVLTPRDLTNDFMTIEQGGIAGFNVLDAEGFGDGYKCNLFVFELAYRAGLRIPMIGRIRGWGYPGPEDVLRQVRRDAFYGEWAVLADHLTLDELRESHEQGIVFMLVGEGSEGRAGHFGMVDEVHQIRHDGIGRILGVTYSGWEANGDGAHYRRRSWDVNRFAAIHLLELQEPRDGEVQCYAVGRGPLLPSDLDLPRFAARLGIDVPTVAGTAVADARDASRDEGASGAGERAEEPQTLMTLVDPWAFAFSDAPPPRGLVDPWTEPIMAPADTGRNEASIDLRNAACSSLSAAAGDEEPVCSIDPFRGLWASFSPGAASRPEGVLAAP